MRRIRARDLTGISLKIGTSTSNSQLILAPGNLIISLAILPGLLALAFIVHTVLWNYVHCEHLFHHPWSRAHSIMIHHPVFPTNDDKKLPPPSSDDSFGFPLLQGQSFLCLTLLFLYKTSTNR